MDAKTTMGAADLQAFLLEQFPQVADSYVVERVGHMEVDVRRKVRDGNLRPGGTVSGPTMFELADVSVYLAILAMITISSMLR
jgi:acyl-coenzyme A thioesterase PaaI-like protein